MNESKGWFFCFLCFIRLNEEGMWVQDILLLPQEFESIHHTYYEQKWCNLMCADCLYMIKPAVVALCFTIAQFRGSQMSPGLFQDFMASIVVMTAGSQSRPSQIYPYGQPIFDSRFMKFVFRISEGIKFWNLSWGLRWWQSEFCYS